MSEIFRVPRKRYWDFPVFRWVLFGMVGMIYLIGRSPHVGFNDGLSFLLEAEQGFSPYTNATSHFLYNNLQHILLEVFSFLPSVLVLTMFSMVCSLLTLGRLYQLVRLFGTPPITWIIPPLVLALSFTFWQQSEIIEVYAFNNLIFINFFYFALKDLLHNESKYTLLVGALLGIGLLTHIQHLLSVPFFIYYLVRVGKNNPLRAVGALGIAGILFFVLFLPPLTSDTNSIASIFFDNQFQSELLGFDMAQLMDGMGKAMMYMMYNFHMFTLAAIVGWVIMFRDRRSLFWQLLLLFVPYFGFAVKYSVADNHVFFLISYLIFLVPSVFTLMAIAMKMLPYMNIMFPMMLMMGPMMYMMATMYAKDSPRFADYQVEKAYKGGVKHLLWPMKNNAPDPLELADALRKNDPGAYERGEVEWNYPAALALLEWREKGE